MVYNCGEILIIKNESIRTVGSLGVNFANTVFYVIVMRKEIYGQLLTKISSLKRYFDDGQGFLSGAKRQFAE